MTLSSLYIKPLIYIYIYYFYPAYARGVRKILQISRGLIIIAFEFITPNFVPRQDFRNAPVSLFRKSLISILAPTCIEYFPVKFWPLGGPNGARRRRVVHPCSVDETA